MVVCVVGCVAGVSSMETMLAHLFSQLLVISVQILLLLLFILLVFEVCVPDSGTGKTHGHTPLMKGPILLFYHRFTLVVFYSKSGPN